MTSQDSWKEFDQNPITHSVAHHLVAIAELLEEYGYARVSDVARHLEITRGSASVTLKGLKQRGLVVEDDHRHLGLSEEGERIAKGVMAKKDIMKELFVRVLGVDADQADVDTCKIEHLISNQSARRALHVLRYLGADPKLSESIVAGVEGFPEGCPGDPGGCPICGEKCLREQLGG